MTLILEVALGLAFVYLLFSLFVSAVNEIVLGHLAHLRARLLEDSIRALLSGTGSRKSPATETFATIGSIFKSIVFLFQPKRTSMVTGIKFADRVLQHPLVQGLATDGKCPSYIPAKTFADAVLESLTRLPNAMGTPFETTAALQATDDFAHQVLRSVLLDIRRVDEARMRLETWFDQSMARVTGLYKRYTQFWLYVWATLIVTLLNVDTLELTRRLLADTEFRNVITASATEFLRTNSAATVLGDTNATNNAASPGQLFSVIDKLRLPIGWGDCVSIDSAAVADVPVLATGILGAGTKCPTTPHDWFVKILGLLISIAAISQGAPFWFDMLNKVANVRAVGRPPEVAPQKKG